MNSPKVNDVVLVRHRSENNGRVVAAKEWGSAYEVHGDKPKVGFCKKSHSSYMPIRAVYMDGTVRTGVGDVWTVEPSQDGKAQWQTVE